MTDMRVSRPLAERFWEKVTRRSPDECWPWLAAANPKTGYGQIGPGGRAPMRLAHRVSYELAFGTIGDGMTIDHLCHNRTALCPGGPRCPHRRCVNPAHLEACLTGTNTARAWDRRTHCVNGHPYSEYTYWHPSGHRRCRLCNTLQARERRRK